MKKILFLSLIILSELTFAQTFRVEKVIGTTKVLDANDKWVEVKVGDLLQPNSIILTGKKSSVKVTGEDLSFTLKESSAIPISNIKKMTLDELLLALAMEDLMSAPRKKQKNKGSKNTAVYGTEEKVNTNEILLSNDFGIKRLKGAVQLVENGLKEAGVITAIETYRKYPTTRDNSYYRIYFANVLYDCRLYEEALDEFDSITKLKLSEKEKNNVKESISLLNKKLANN
jgi:hypothetical protein